MFCNACGEKFARGDNAFCTSCGTPMEATSKAIELMRSQAEAPRPPTPDPTPHEPTFGRGQEHHGGAPQHIPEWQAPPVNPAAPGKKSGISPVLLGLLILSAAICLGGIAWHFIASGGGGGGGGRPANGATGPGATIGVSATPTPTPAPPAGIPAPQPAEPAVPTPSIDFSDLPPVEVEPPAPAEVLPRTFDEVVLGTSDWVRLNVLWANGQMTVFERDRHSPVWTIQSRDGNYRIVEPSFSHEPGTFLIAFPTTPQMYRLYADKTGNFGGETLTWSFETDPSFSRMSVSGAHMTSDLSSALNSYLLMVIRVYWFNGETTIFYKQSDGTWMMKGRNGSFTSVAPGFSSSGGSVFMSFPTTAIQYVFNSNGAGTFGNESFNWSYSFSDS